MRHHGRFSNTAHGESADANHRSLEGMLGGNTERDVGAMAGTPDPGERREDNARGKFGKRAGDAFGERFPDSGCDAGGHAAFRLRQIAGALAEGGTVGKKLRDSGPEFRGLDERKGASVDETRWRSPRSFPCAARR